jgi:hypothetical protein
MGSIAKAALEQVKAKWKVNFWSKKFIPLQEM